MNIKYNFTDTGGFPLDQNVLNDLQNGILLTEKALANLLGPLAIISGCVVTGGSATNGVVAINGQILPFVGGVIAAKVIIVEVDTDETYFNGAINPSIITRYATFGDDGVQNNPWAAFTSNNGQGNGSMWQTGDIKEIFCTEAYITANFDTSGTSTDGLGLIGGQRYGWAICNSKNGTPDKRGVVTVGRNTGDASFATMTSTGGEKTHTLTVGEIPSHGHSFIDPTGGLDYGSGSTRASNTNANAGTTGNTGGDGAHNNLQPYVTGLFIMKL
jgi:hypothetical protein